MKDAPQVVINANEAYQKLVGTLFVGRASVVAVGKYLFELNQEDRWRDAVGSVDTWSDFLKLPEINLDTREANRAMEIYEEFAVKRNYDINELGKVSTKALHSLLPLVKKGALDDEQVKGLLADGANLSQAGFKERLHDVKFEKTVDKPQRTYQFMLMRKCIETGTMAKVHDINHNDIVAVFNRAGINLDKQFVAEII